MREMVVKLENSRKYIKSLNYEVKGKIAQVKTNFFVHQSPEKIWRSKIISFAGKLNLYEPLVIFILLCGCETWILLADSETENDSGFGDQVP